MGWTWAQRRCAAGRVGQQRAGAGRARGCMGGAIGRFAVQLPLEQCQVMRCIWAFITQDGVTTVVQQQPTHVSMPRQVRVSHERYIPFAEWLVARLGPPFLAPRQYGGTGWVASVDLFVRSVRGTLGEGKPRPAMELMILGPEDPKYDDPVTPVGRYAMPTCV